MGILGNLSKGLPPNEKHRLYRACCLPIALYGCRLWHYHKVPMAAHLKQLRTLQGQAAHWITGTFCTSPFGDMEALAGLPPIGAIARKAAKKFAARTPTLHKGHPVLELMPGSSHPRAVGKTKRGRRVRSPLVDAADPLIGPTEKRDFPPTRSGGFTELAAYP